MNYAAAMQAVNDNQRVRRMTWPPGWFLLRVPGSTFTVEADRPLGKAAPELVGREVHYGAHVDIYRDGYLAPWHALHDDIHAGDWEIC